MDEIKYIYLRKEVVRNGIKIIQTKDFRFSRLRETEEDLDKTQN